MIGILAGSSLSEAKMRLNKTAVTLTVGESVQLELKGAKKNVTWKSSDPSVATVSKKGFVMGTSNTDRTNLTGLLWFERTQRNTSLSMRTEQRMAGRSATGSPLFLSDYFIRISIFRTSCE